MEPHLADAGSDAELDALPSGVIAVDEAGTILRYNLHESRFARIDRNQVLGRNFFDEVAWCTRNEAFEGRFRAFVKGGGGDADPDGVLRFPFLFDSPFGAQEVLIEIARAAPAPRFYLFVNRLRIHPPRPGFPVEMLGVLQRDLAPDEAKQGVQRDGLERRFVEALPYARCKAPGEPSFSRPSPGRRALERTPLMKMLLAAVVALVSTACAASVPKAEEVHAAQAAPTPPTPPGPPDLNAPRPPPASACPADLHAAVGQACTGGTTCGDAARPGFGLLCRDDTWQEGEMPRVPCCKKMP